MNSSPLGDPISFPSLEQDDSQEKGPRVVAMAATSAEAAITTTMTQFQAPPIASPTQFFFPSSIPFYTTTYTTTVTPTTQPSLLPAPPPPSSSSAPLNLFSFDNASPWHHFFPALVAFAILGALSALLFLLLLFMCIYRRRRQRQRYSLENNVLNTNSSRRPPLCDYTEKVQTPSSTPTLHHLAIPEPRNSTHATLQYLPPRPPPPQQQQQQQQPGYHPYPISMFPISGSAPPTPRHPRPYHCFAISSSSSSSSSTTTTPEPVVSSPVSSTFVPIETSPLTLVPRAAIWKDPQRRRGVNELDLWEQKQQRQQQQQQPVSTPQPQQHNDDPGSTSTTVQPGFTSFTFLQHDARTDDDDDDDDADSGESLDNGKDRPWQRYVQSRPSDLNNNDDDDQHSLHSSSTISHPHPIYNLNQEVCGSRTMDSQKIEQDTAATVANGCLGSSSSSQWLCPPSELKS